MRASLSPVTATIVVAFFAVACGSTASPAPVPTPSPSVPPTQTLAPAAPSPTPIPWPSPAAVAENTAIAAGYQHTCAITSAGGVACWGMSMDELNAGTSSGASAPVNVPGLSSGVLAVAAGGFSSCALTTAGGVKCWGYNMYGQLGNGSNMDSGVPVDVVGLGSGVAAITVGWSSACAVTDTGGVKCWGHNHYGWLGDGTTNDSNVPVDVVGLESGVRAIATGVLHTCALTAGGGVKCWGFGQSDDPSVFTTSLPTDVPGFASGTATIAAALDRTCARSTGGDVTCWGPNYGPPTDGSPVPDRFVTVDVSGLEGGVTAIAVAEGHACALTGSGGVACWGNDSYGELGRGITSDNLAQTPLEVMNLGSRVTGIAVGAMHTCALSNGGVICWGSNARGQLGIVMRCSSTRVPVAVPLEGDATPPAGGGSTSIPTGRIVHATGPTDVVLRYDRGPDFAVGDLVGELFQPGPEFTLYGDGTVIFRNESAQPPPADGPIIRGGPFMSGRLNGAQIQSLLRFALSEGGLWDACDRYETDETDVSSSDVFTIRAGGLDKRVVNGPFGAVSGHLRTFDQSIPTTVWVPDRYVGNLLDASIFANIGDGTTPGLAEFGTVPWPWPGIAPEDFAGLGEFRSGRRVMSTDEASALGLSDGGGVVQRVYLRGPDGRTNYYFSLWPMSPDEQS